MQGFCVDVYNYKANSCLPPPIDTNKAHKLRLEQLHIQKISLHHSTTSNITRLPQTLKFTVNFLTQSYLGVVQPIS